MHYKEMSKGMDRSATTHVTEHHQGQSRLLIRAFVQRRADKHSCLVNREEHPI